MKYTTEDVAILIENEGLAYAIEDYLDADDIVDPELAQLWRETKVKMDAIMEFCRGFSANDQ